jgi:hypothetical protein
MGRLTHGGNGRDHVVRGSGWDERLRADPTTFGWMGTETGCVALPAGLDTVRKGHAGEQGTQLPCAPSDLPTRIARPFCTKWGKSFYILPPNNSMYRQCTQTPLAPFSHQLYCSHTTVHSLVCGDNGLSLARDPCDF